MAQHHLPFISDNLGLYVLEDAISIRLFFFLALFREFKK